MGPDDKRILEALDMLALALTNYNHEWTIGQRGAYEEAVSILKTRQQTGAIVFPALDEQCAAKSKEAAEQHTTQAKGFEDSTQICPDCVDGWQGCKGGRWKCKTCGGSGKLLPC
jgi:hypothetical protein